MTSTRTIANTTDLVEHWRDTARDGRRVVQHLAVLVGVVMASLLQFPMAWMLGIGRHHALLVYGVPAWIVVCAMLWLAWSRWRGLSAAWLAGTFAAGALIALAWVSFLFWIGFLWTVPLWILPGLATWALASASRSLLEDASFAARPFRNAIAFAAGAILPCALAFGLHSAIVARGDAYAAALRSGDAARIEQTASAFRPFASWIDIESSAIGDRALGPLPVGASDMSSDVSVLEARLAVAR